MPMTDEQMLHSLLGLKDVMASHGDTGYLAALDEVIAELRRRIETEAIMDDDLKKAIAAAKPAPCGIHCTVCEGMDHHWMPDCDDETGDPVMVCKHCDATTEYFDEDEDEDDAAPDKETFK